MTSAPTRRATNAAAALLALVMLACGGGSQVAPTTTAPNGYTVMSSAKGGFALAVPSDWTPVPLSDTPAKFDKTANDLRAANPKLASILNQARLLGQSGGLFMALIPDGTGSVNLTADKPKEKTLEQIATNSVTGLQNVGASNIKQEQTTLDGEPAVKLTFRIPLETDAGVVPTDEVQHYVLKHSKAYILTVAAAPADVVNTIVGSFKLR